MKEWWGWGVEDREGVGRDVMEGGESGGGYGCRE